MVLESKLFWGGGAQPPLVLMMFRPWIWRRKTEVTHGYGKGMVHHIHESAIAIVKDYDLPVTPQQYSQSLLPMYHQK